MEWVCDLWGWFRDNFSSIANLVFAGTVVSAAVASFLLTRKLVDETIELRKAETDPFVAVYIETRKTDFGTFDFVIRNVARGSAFDVEFEVVPDLAIWEGEQYRLSDATAISEGISYMAPGQEIRFFFGSYMELIKEPIQILVSYSGNGNKERRVRFSEKFTIDSRQFAGMVHVDEVSTVSIAGSLEKIARDIEAIRKGDGSSRVAVAVTRRYFFSRYANRKWNRVFGPRNMANPQNSLGDLWRGLNRDRNRRKS